MNIEIKLDKPLQNLLERIATALENLNVAPAQTDDIPEQKTVEAIEPKPDTVETAGLVGQIHSYEPAAPAQPEAQPSVTLDQIRKQVVTLSAAGAEIKAKVREIITEYGRNVSAIPADKYPEVMDRLTALKEG